MTAQRSWQRLISPKSGAYIFSPTLMSNPRPLCG